MGASITTFSQWAINTSAGALPAIQLIDRVSGRLGVRQEYVKSMGQNASLTDRQNRIRVSATPIEPTFSFEPTATELSYLLPWLMGAAGVGTTPIVYSASNAFPLRAVQGTEDQDGTTVLHNFTNLAVDGFTIRSQAGGLIGLDVETVSSGGAYEQSTAFPSLSNFDTTTEPFVFPDLTGDGATGADGTFTIGGTARDTFGINLSVRHGLDRGRMPHTLTPKGLRKRTRDITLTLDMPADQATAIYASSMTALTPRAVTMRWRNPNATVEYLEIEIPAMVFPRPDVDLPPRGEIRHNPVGFAVYDGTNAPLIVRLQIRT